MSIHPSSWYFALILDMGSVCLRSKCQRKSLTRHKAEMSVGQQHPMTPMTPMTVKLYFLYCLFFGHYLQIFPAIGSNLVHCWFTTWIASLIYSPFSCHLRQKRPTFRRRRGPAMSYAFGVSESTSSDRFGVGGWQSNTVITHEFKTLHDKLLHLTSELLYSSRITIDFARFCYLNSHVSSGHSFLVAWAQRFIVST